ncbi:EboA domain-containing protein [Streptomyces sp. NPDC058657]|uniref:EboA domain-containing protein n=1 Tax=Streptomyces sp. NPDC058657 TaxID=3346579 RepID=UPI00365D0DEB
MPPSAPPHIPAWELRFAEAGRHCHPRTSDGPNPRPTSATAPGPRAPAGPSASPTPALARTTPAPTPASTGPAFTGPASECAPAPTGPSASPTPALARTTPAPTPASTGPASECAPAPTGPASELTPAPTGPAFDPTTATAASTAPAPSPAPASDLAASARVLLLHAAHADLDTVRRLYSGGSAAERRAVLLALPHLDRLRDGSALPLVEDALRTHDTRLLTAAVGPYAAAHLPPHAWRHAVLKCLFTGVPVASVASLAGRSRGDTELARMLTDYAAERTAAGRPVPADLHRVRTLTTPAEES